MKKIFAVLLAAAALLCAGSAVYADGVPEVGIETWDEIPTSLDASSVSVPYAILTEADTGAVLYEKDADTRTAPASVTKVMSLLLVMEAIERGDLAPDEKVTCSPHAASMGGSQIWLEPGESMTADDLIKAVAVGSANDAIVALAEHIAGSEEEFVARMNERARELGMVNTNYMNASGLDADNHYTSARDTALVSSELIKHELITRYSTIWMDTLRGGETQLVNTNRLVRFYDGITGLKTGTTDKAGCCLTATAQRGALKLVAVVFGAPNSDTRFSTARKLLDYGFANYTVYTPEAIADTQVKAVRGTAARVTLKAGAISPILLRKGAEKGVTAEVAIPESVAAPIAAGAAVGRVTLKAADGTEIGGYDIVAAEEVGKLTWGKAFTELLKRLAAAG